VEQWHLIIDITKCEECNNCFLSCKDEHVDNDFLPYSVAQPRHGHRWIDVVTKERGQCPKVDVVNVPVPCMHCKNAPCVNAGQGAIYRMSSGAVIIDPVKAKGKQALVGTCPYGAIWWNAERDVAQKCTFCAHLLMEGWKAPRCVQSCPTDAMRFVKATEAELEQIIIQEHLEVLHPEYKTQPRVYYKNLHRYRKCFVGGDVALEKGGIVDCAEGAKVSLFKSAEKVGEMLTDNYGDFKFDGLDEESGRYTIEIALDGYQKKSVQVDLTQSINVGTLMLWAVV